jgi:hypothetical protein
LLIIANIRFKVEGSRVKVEGSRVKDEGSRLKVGKFVRFGLTFFLLGQRVEVHLSTSVAAIRYNLFCSKAAKKDFPFYPLPLGGRNIFSFYYSVEHSQKQITEPFIYT